MKRILTIVLAIILAAGALAACNNDAHNNETLDQLPGLSAEKNELYSFLKNNSLEFFEKARSKDLESNLPRIVVDSNYSRTSVSCMDTDFRYKEHYLKADYNYKPVMFFYYDYSNSFINIWENQIEALCFAFGVLNKVEYETALLELSTFGDIKINYDISVRVLTPEGASVGFTEQSFDSEESAKKYYSFLLRYIHQVDIDAEDYAPNPNILQYKNTVIDHSFNLIDLLYLEEEKMQYYDIEKTKTLYNIYLNEIAQTLGI